MPNYESRTTHFFLRAASLASLAAAPPLLTPTFAPRPLSPPPRATGSAPGRTADRLRDALLGAALGATSGSGKWLRQGPVQKKHSALANRSRGRARTAIAF